MISYRNLDQTITPVAPHSEWVQYLGGRVPPVSNITRCAGEVGVRGPVSYGSSTLAVGG